MTQNSAESLRPLPLPIQLYVPPEFPARRPGTPWQVMQAFVHVLRPRQWIKNTSCLAGLIFSHQLFDGAARLTALVATMMFCAASGCVYVINDICDREKDRLNPKKAGRPIASGVLPVWVAGLGCLGCLAVSGLAAGYLGASCAVVLVLYLAMNVVYSLRLKHTVLADVLVIAMGFVFRVLAGVFAVHAQPTAWIILCIFFLALFLGFAKRRGELAALGERAAAHRPVLAKYTLPYLDTVLAVTATMTIICYAVYTIEARHINDSMIITIPPVVYGIARYLLLVMVRGGEAPEDLLTRDRGMLAAVAVWIGLCLFVLYANINLFNEGQ
ncbi:hypothetical protein AYO44_18100 [Planctomycetaceae bacterium SCGC AG-212-F19]|nr:hypothetical protein AYO44_18100 [Planctomycetaceae bacterium SCGC AG-212-F19]